MASSLVSVRPFTINESSLSAHYYIDAHRSTRGKHYPAYFRETNQVSKMKDVHYSDVMPVVMVRDPYTWMQVSKSRCVGPWFAIFDTDTAALFLLSTVTMSTAVQCSIRSQQEYLPQHYPIPYRHFGSPPICQDEVCSHPSHLLERAILKVQAPIASALLEQLEQ